MLRSYTPADLLTLANASCGALSIFACLGYVARLNRKRQSVFGADLDSLADIVSFGVAPAVLGYTLGLRGLWDVLCLAYFICCGISRLARFNVTSAALTNIETGKVRYFEGTPIPTSILLVALMAVLFHLDMTGNSFPGGHVLLLGRGFHPISVLFVISGSLMISTIRVPKP
jgi:CDP-diacylglycerol--serine O-phosphatidyltransferase